MPLPPLGISLGASEAFFAESWTAIPAPLRKGGTGAPMSDTPLLYIVDGPSAPLAVPALTATALLPPLPEAPAGNVDAEEVVDG